MALKTFNIQEEVHKAYAEHCKKEGISMSKKVENFIKKELESINKKSQTNQVKNSLQKEEHSFKKYC